MLGLEPRSSDTASCVFHRVIVLRPRLVSPVAEYIRLHPPQLDMCGRYLDNLENEKLYFRGSFHSLKQLNFSSNVSSSVKPF